MKWVFFSRRPKQKLLKDIKDNVFNSNSRLVFCYPTKRESEPGVLQGTSDASIPQRLSWVRWDRNWQFKPQLWQGKSNGKMDKNGGCLVWARFFLMFWTPQSWMLKMYVFNEPVTKMDFKEQIMHCPLFSIFWGSNCQHVFGKQVRLEWFMLLDFSCIIIFLDLPASQWKVNVYRDPRWPKTRHPRTFGEKTSDLKVASWISNSLRQFLAS